MLLCPLCSKTPVHRLAGNLRGLLFVGILCINKLIWEVIHKTQHMLIQQGLRFSGMACVITLGDERLLQIWGRGS